MKVSTIGLLFCFTGLVALGGSCAYAQSEIDPDHFESLNTEPFSQPKPNANSQVAETRYEGRFALPYPLLCGGNRLAPGTYTISLRSDGKVGQAILNLKGQAIGIAGVVHQQAHKRDNNALIVERKGKIRTLSFIHVAGSDFIFDPIRQIEISAKSKMERFERLPLMLLAPKMGHGSAE